MPNETITGLLPNTSYEFWVVAKNIAGSGPDSSILLVKTPETQIQTDPFSTIFSVDFG